jgi:S-(hydroxymethyl)glutathione dehydrogenase/alcohol dehydrogenase
MLNWAMPCGRCFQCAIGNQHLCERHNPVVGTGRREDRRNDTTLDGHPVLRAFDLGTMSTHSCVRVEALTPLTIDIPFPSAAIIGCGVMTGFGSVVNCARVPAGSTVVVIGCGGVGLSAIQGARIAGAGQIIAVDLKDRRLDMATRVGATHLIKPAADDAELKDVAQQVKAMTDGRGADFAFESTGVPALAATPLRMIRHGGLAVQISGTEQDITVDMRLFEFDKAYINPLYGQCVPARDFPRLLSLYAQGKLLLDEIVTSTYPLDDVATAFDDLLAGTGAKGCLVFE